MSLTSPSRDALVRYRLIDAALEPYSPSSMSCIVVLGGELLIKRAYRLARRRSRNQDRF